LLADLMDLEDTITMELIMVTMDIMQIMEQRDIMVIMELQDTTQPPTTPSVLAAPIRWAE